ncbi:MAG: 50S ribosomal protein L2 [Alphaproteobacteria bacterium]
MGLKKYNPITPGMRQLVQIDRSELWAGKPVKALTEGLTRTGGRNNKGRITTRHIGGGHARRYRLIDFKRTKHDMSAVVERLEYDPNRTAFIALIKYQDGTLSYILAPQRLKTGDEVVSGIKVDVKPGNAMPLKSIPVGTIIHNVEMKPGKGGQLARSAGTYVQLVGRDSGFAQIKLSSGELRKVPQDCIATIGAVSNADHGNTQIGKAGRNRWKGIRPTVRGVAMNPIDHPHGGGEGRTSGGRHPVTPWGKGTKGTKTRNNKRTDGMIIRRQNKRRDAQGANR